ncbi:MAG TPA: hypothetical protein VNO33_00325 [Kofleriaceae bacterium]|nr:hypothetical protein [Kofleriaceae bacterium]
MLDEVEQVLERLYPTRRWGQPDDIARFGAGLSEADGQALADELASELDAVALFRPGQEEEYCDYIYVLCVGREPCAVQLRDGQVPVPDEIAEIGEGEVIREQYLRVCLSSMARLAGVQQTAIELWRAGEDLVIRELPRAGVYDAPLLRRFQRLVAILPAYDILHVDFGEISAPPDGFDPGEYLERYGSLPHRANYLFYPQPTTTEITSLLPRAELRPAF